MKYSTQVYNKAEKEMNRRRVTAQDTAQHHLDAFYAACSEAQDLRWRIASTASRAARAALRGAPAHKMIESLKEENLSLQKQFNDLLAAHNLTRADIEPQYTCKKCEDTGYIDGHMCSCYRTLLQQIAYENLNSISPLTLSSFEDFSLKYYSDVSVDGKRSDRETMRIIFDYCRHYADTFNSNSGNLFFTGATGLGKTHLSLAIAAEAIEKGFGVVYGNAITFAVALERERFAQSEDSNGDTLSLLNTCELLIMDDLGVEASSNYVTSTIYSVIDTRIITKKPTIISSNLSLQELEKRYGARLASRMVGFYDRMVFCGKDVRMQRKLNSRIDTPHS